MTICILHTAYIVDIVSGKTTEHAHAHTDTSTLLMSYKFIIRTACAETVMHCCGSETHAICTIPCVVSTVFFIWIFFLVAVNGVAIVDFYLSHRPKHGKSRDFPWVSGVEDMNC